MQHQLYEFSLFCLILILAITTVVQSGDEQCQACNRLASAFQRGLERTSRDNFGGGNTNWEETRLGVYALSETRLVDITEKLCKDESGSAASACHAMLERVEEDIERWWFGPFKANPSAADLREYVCVNRTGVCCGYGRWGADCTTCNTCSGHGDCNGNGTRTGTGACDCHRGYTGVHCADCAPRFHRASSAGDAKSDVQEIGDCLACHAGCRSACNGPLATQCDACADGYRLLEAGCTDINECVVSSVCSGQRQFCENTPGSYACRDCDPACAACTGIGASACTKCSTGYEPAASGSGCQDVNECSPDSPHCSGPYEKCVNLPGSHRCDCQAGYHRQNGQCVPKPAKKPAAKAPGPGGKKRAEPGKKSKPPKLIWTVAYTLEFAKFFAAIVGLGIFAVAVKGRPIPVVLAACVAGWYLCQQSSVLDRVYLQARG